jgi:hypothetical protein
MSFEACIFKNDNSPSVLNYKRFGPPDAQHAREPPRPYYLVDQNRTHTCKDRGESLDMEIDGYTELEDTETDKLCEQYGECEDCHEPDTGYCRCQNVDSDMERWNTSEEAVYFIYRRQSEAHDRSRSMRQLKRKHLRNVVLWRRAAGMNGIVNYWSKMTVAPDSKATQVTAKRFKQMQTAEAL